LPVAEAFAACAASVAGTGAFEAAFGSGAGKAEFAAAAPEPLDESIT
jgi:hypothetical protein